jgi:hypothetical protein
MQPWRKWKFSEEERDRIGEILDELYSMMLPKVGGVVVGMERVRDEGRPGGDMLLECLLLEWQEGWGDLFWVGGGYPYLRGKVLRRLGMGGPMAMHALVCGLLHGRWERQKTVVVDGVEQQRPAEVKVAMHLCGKGRLGHREGRSTCCILPWHLQWGTVQQNVDAGHKRRREREEERAAKSAKAISTRWGRQ